jgi:hypothetical protein
MRTLVELRLIDLIGAVRQCACCSSRVRVFGGLGRMLTPFHLTDDDEAAMLSEQANADRSAEVAAMPSAASGVGEAGDVRSRSWRLPGPDAADAAAVSADGERGADDAGREECDGASKSMFGSGRRTQRAAEMRGELLDPTANTESEAGRKTQLSLLG